MSNRGAYVSLARFDNWSKNLLMLAGVGLAYMLTGASLWIHVTDIMLALFSPCLSSSANYVLNEAIDARFDAYHPLKHVRAAAAYKLDNRIIIAEYVAFALSALLVAYYVHAAVAFIVFIYIAAAWLYNIPPVRIKDHAYIDALLESANYPIRLLIGWMCVLPEVLPPSTIILIGWSIGAFAMSVKRLAEYQLFSNPQEAMRYRKSYRVYDLNRLIASSFVYSPLSIFAVTVFLLKYRVEFLLLLPLIIVWFAWYFILGLHKNEHTIYPERLFKNKALMVLTTVVIVAASILANIELSWLHIFSTPLYFGTSVISQ